MGSTAEEIGRQTDEIRHRVRITHTFYMQTAEVTQGQWRTIVNTTSNTLTPNPSHFAACGDNCPVESITWEDVQIFIDVLNTTYKDAYEFRLPTEAEWEYAARAGSDTAFSNGPITEVECELDPVLDAIGWYCGNSAVTYAGCDDASGYGGPVCAGLHGCREEPPQCLGTP